MLNIIIIFNLLVNSDLNYFHTEWNDFKSINFKNLVKKRI